jgi:hypothetical protein
MAVEDDATLQIGGQSPDPVNVKGVAGDKWNGQNLADGEASGGSSCHSQMYMTL